MHTSNGTHIRDNGLRLFAESRLCRRRNRPSPVKYQSFKTIAPFNVEKGYEYREKGRKYKVLTSSRGYKKKGIASWYGPNFNGKATACGEIYDMFDFTAAHKTLPLPSYLRVKNLTNGRTVVVKVNDRGPFVNNRVIDLSYAAARRN